MDVMHLFQLLCLLSCKAFPEAEAQTAEDQVHTVKLRWLEGRGYNDLHSSSASGSLTEAQQLLGAQGSTGSLRGLGNDIMTKKQTNERVRTVVSDLAKDILSANGGGSSTVQVLSDLLDLVAEELDCTDLSAAFVYKLPDLMPALIIGTWAVGRNTSSDIRFCLRAPTHDVDISQAFTGSIEDCPHCVNTDWLHNAVMDVIGFASVLEQDGHSVDILMKLQQVLERCLEPHSFKESGKNGGVDGLKYDGSGYHHWNYYPGYMYAFKTMAEKALPLLTATRFQVSRRHLLNLRDHAILQQVMSNPSKMGNALCGRHPFDARMTTDLPGVKALLEDNGGSDDFLDRASSGGKALDGFWQANYGNLGVMRMSTCDGGYACSWVVTFKGFTSELWGAEIYTHQNRYGRNQGFGEVSVSLANDNQAMDKAGWDWNHPPGSTTIKINFQDMLPKGSRMDTFAGTDFAGSLRGGHDRLKGVAEQGRSLVEQHRGSFGIFGLHLEDVRGSFGNGLFSGGLGFKQSCTAFADAVFCAGTDIHAETGSQVVTTLSQETGAVADAVPPDFPQTGCSILQPGWFESGRGVTYYTWNTVQLCRTVIQSPDQSGSGTNEGTSLLAYVDHGTQVSAGSYAYLFLLGTTVDKSILASTEFLQQDALAHVLQRTDYQGTTVFTYAFFGSTGSDHGPVKTTSGACLITTVQSQLNRMNISVAVPSGVNSNQQFSIILELRLEATIAAEDNLGAAASASLTNKRLTVHAKYGEPVDLTLNLATTDRTTTSDAGGWISQDDEQGSSDDIEVVIAPLTEASSTTTASLTEASSTTTNPTPTDANKASVAQTIFKGRSTHSCVVALIAVFLLS